MAMGARIKSEREGLGWTQQQLADRVNEHLREGEKPLTQQALDRLEKRDSKTSEFAIRLADALNVSVRWMLDGQAPREGSTDEPGAAEIHQKLISLSPEDISSICANLAEPERQRLTRLIVVGGFVPGLTVEVRGKWNPEIRAKSKEFPADASGPFGEPEAPKLVAVKKPAPPKDTK